MGCMGVGWFRSFRPTGGLEGVDGMSVFDWLHRVLYAREEMM